MSAPAPFAMRKLRLQPLYTVYNKATRRVYAKATTKEKAERQLKLLRAITYNPDFEKRPPGEAVGGRATRRTRRLWHRDAAT
jgi:hypothetical protein